MNSCKCRNVNPAGKDAVLNLLAVEFSETDAPGGVVTLIFSGGGVLRLEVECLEPSLPISGRPGRRRRAPSTPRTHATPGVDGLSSPSH